MRRASRLCVLAAAAAALILGAPAASQEIQSAPAFTAKQLMEPPTADWVTNGGTLWNQRYSPLTMINRENVGQLKAKWRTGMVTGVTPNNSNEAQILTWQDTLYVANGESHVFAMDIDTGKILWDYEAKPPPRPNGAAQGRSSRGVGMGDGMIFVSAVDSTLAALDQKTGKLLWKTVVEDWTLGYSITTAPLYYDGMVITGVSGGVMARRCNIKAYDAKTGKLLWTFHTIPGPGEFGHETWPQGTDAWKHGGAPVWQTPAVDPELGLLYFATGNPGPVLAGSIRPGDNLFANSLVALDAKTGKYRWHFQQIHHDIWDLDASNPIVLFDANVGGRARKGLVQVGKTGWAYILDRTNGRPLIGINERPVPQEPRQHTARTQPIPVGDPIVPQEIDIVPEGIKLPVGETELFNKGRLFTPFWTETRVMKPSSQGGASWPPSSFDPTTNTLFVCATDKTSTYTITLPLEPVVDGAPYFGGRMGATPTPAQGVFAALDVRTNRLKWRLHWKEPCYTGSVATAGGILFVGRSDGRLTALDNRNGATLWEFMTDGGVNTTVTTFEHKGQQMVVVHAGGSLFGNGRRGDGIWMFSLDGTIGPVRPGGGGPAPAAARPAAAVPAAAQPVNLANGQALYLQGCVACHGDTGAGGLGGGTPLNSGQSAEAMLAVITTGRNTMPAFADVYTPAQRRDITAYITDVLQKRR